MLNIGVKKAVYTCCPDFLHPVLNRMEASPIGYRLAKGVFWSMAGTVISRGLMLFASILVARILGKTGFGELGIIQSTVGMFGVFAGFGLGLTAIKHVAEFRINNPVRAGRIISLSLLVALITGGLMALGLLLSAPWLAMHTINAPHLSGVLRIGTLILFINALNGAQTGALSGFEVFKTIACINLLVGLISFPILITGAYFGGVTGAVWALVINLGINWLLNHMALRKETRRYNILFSIRDCYKELPILWKFSFPSVLSEAIVVPVIWVCNTMIVNQPDGYKELGIFTASLVFHQILLFASNMLNAPLLSILSNTGVTKNTRLETTNIISSWILGLFPSLLFLCFPEIINIFFGSQYQGHTLKATFIIVVFYTSILTYRAGLLRVLQSKSLLWWGLLNNLLWAVVLLSTAYFLVKWGAIGLAASFAIAYIINSIVFIPIYMWCAEVPYYLLISKGSIFIWLILVFMAIVNLWGIQFIYRAIALPIEIFFVGWALKSVWNQSLKRTEQNKQV